MSIIWRTEAERRAELEQLLHAGYRYALALSHRQADAQDYVQDAWLHLHRGGYRITRPLFFTTIRNLFFDKHRREHVVVFEPIDEAPESGIEDPVVDITDTALEQCLGILRAVEREALFLQVVEGYSASETAKLMGLNRNTVLSLLARAKQKLRTAIGETGMNGSARRGK